MNIKKYLYEKNLLIEACFQTYKKILKNDLTGVYEKDASLFLPVEKYAESIINNPESEYYKVKHSNQCNIDDSFCNAWMLKMVQDVLDYKQGKGCSKGLWDCSSNEGVGLAIKALKSYADDTLGWRSTKGIDSCDLIVYKDHSLCNEVYLANLCLKRIDKIDETYTNPEDAKKATIELSENTLNLIELSKLQTSKSDFNLDIDDIERYVMSKARIGKATSVINNACLEQIDDVFEKYKKGTLSKHDIKVANTFAKEANNFNGKIHNDSYRARKIIKDQINDFKKYHEKPTFSEDELNRVYNHNSYVSKFESEHIEVEKTKKTKEKPVKIRKEKRKKIKRSHNRQNLDIGRAFSSFFKSLFKVIKSIFAFLCKIFKYIFNGILFIFKSIAHGIASLFRNHLKITLIVSGILVVAGAITSIIVINSKPPTFYFDNGVMTVEPSCSEKGVFKQTFKIKEGIRTTNTTTYKYSIPEHHDFDSTNTCKLCGTHLDIDLNKILYTKLSDDKGEYICVWSILPSIRSNNSQLIIPPYIENLPVKEVYLNIYDPEIEKDCPLLEELPENISSTISNIYGTTSASEIIVYSSGSDECVYYGNTEVSKNRQHSITANNVSLVGDFNDVYVSKYASANTFILDGNIDSFVEEVVHSCKEIVFTKNVREYVINSGKDGLSIDFVVPYGLEYLKLPGGVFDMFFLNYKSKYFIAGDNYSISSCSSFYGTNGQVSDFSDYPNLKVGTPNFVLSDKMNFYYDCYRVENGFRPKLVKDLVTNDIYTIDDLIGYASRAGTGNEQTRYKDCNFKLMNDIDANGAEVCFSWFEGIFDGNGYTIKNVSSDSGRPLFSVNCGTIKNLTLDNFNIKGSNNDNSSNAILISTCKGNLINCKITNSTLMCDLNTCGALCGTTSGSDVTIKNCEVSNCKISYVDKYYSDVKIGGLVGKTNTTRGIFDHLISRNNQIEILSNIAFSYSGATVSHSYLYVGNVFGYFDSTSSEATNMLSESNSIKISGNTSPEVLNGKKSVGSISVGGLVGTCEYGIAVKNSFAINNSFDINCVKSDSSKNMTIYVCVSETTNSISELSESDLNLFSNKVEDNTTLIGLSGNTRLPSESQISKANISVVDLSLFVLPQNMIDSGWSILNEEVKLTFSND